MITLLVATLSAVSRSFVTNTKNGKKQMFEGKPDSIEVVEGGYKVKFGNTEFTVGDLKSRDLTGLKAGDQFVKLSNGATLGIRTIGQTHASVGRVGASGGFVKDTTEDMTLEELVTGAVPKEFAGFIGDSAGAISDEE